MVCVCVLGTYLSRTYLLACLHLNCLLSIQTDLSDFLNYTWMLESFSGRQGRSPFERKVGRWLLQTEQEQGTLRMDRVFQNASSFRGQLCLLAGGDDMQLGGRPLFQMKDGQGLSPWTNLLLSWVKGTKREMN